MINRLSAILLTAALGLITAPATSWAEKTLHLGCISADGMKDVELFREIFEPVLQRHNYTLIIEQMPTDETSRRLFAGELDGSCGQDEFYGPRHDGIVHKVGPSFRHAILTIWGHAASRGTSPSQLTIGHPKGWDLYIPLLDRFGYKAWREYEHIDDMTAAVSRGEIDAFLTYYAAIDHKEHHLHQQDIIYHRDVLALDVFLHLKPEFKFLFGDLAEAIRRNNEQQIFPDMNAAKFRHGGERHIVFGCSIPPKYPLFNVIELFYRQAFAELGYGFSMIPMPRAREVAELLNGRLDGTCARGEIAPFITSPELIRVDTAIGRSSTQLITTLKGLKGTDDIPARGNIYYVRGTQTSNTFISDRLERSFKGLNTVEAGLKMLSAGRIDFFIDSSAILKNSLEYLQLGNTFHHIPMGKSYEMFPYLNRRHLALAQPLSIQLRQQLTHWPSRYLVDM